MEAKGSKAARQMAEWVVAIRNYAEIMENTKPLRGQVEELSVLRDENLAKLDAKKNELHTLLAEVRRLEDELTAARSQGERAAH